jgi:hypothetical protein
MMMLPSDDEMRVEKGRGGALSDAESEASAHRSSNASESDWLRVLDTVRRWMNAGPLGRSADQLSRSIVPIISLISAFHLDRSSHPLITGRRFKSM